MNQHLPALVIVVPLISALVISAVGWINSRYCFPLAIAALSISLAASTSLLAAVLKSGPMVYNMAGWKAPIGIAYVIDYLNTPVLMVIFTVALLNLIASKHSIDEEFADKTGPFYGLYILFVAGMAGIVATGDAFNLYVLLEIASLTGYALIGMGRERAPLSSLNYLFMGTIGASFYLLGVGYLYIATGTLNMADIARMVPTLTNSVTLLFAFLICMTGLFVKMALFPMHGWLPNAYCNAPLTSSGLIAPLTTKVMIYVMIRCGLFIFTPAFTFKSTAIGNAVVWIGISAIVMGSLMALAQKNLLKMLTYIVVAEVGYMVGGFWLGNRMGITGATLHIINDAMITLCLFLAAAIIIHKTGTDSLSGMKGLFRKMPFTMTGLLTGGLALIGIPPTCGFFSKWYLITGGITAGHYGFVAALLFSSLINAVLFFRIFEIAWFEPFTEPQAHTEDRRDPINETSLVKLVPLLLAAASLIILGIYAGDIVTEIIQRAIPPELS